MAFSINLTPQQEELVDSLREPLGASTKAQVFQRALALAQLYKEALDKGQHLLIADKNGRSIERVRLI